MQVLRILTVRDRFEWEGGLPAARKITRVAACAVVKNPLAGRASEDVSELVGFGALLGERLSQEALSLLSLPVISYGKAAIIGTGGEIEHGAAVLHPQMGKPMRAAIGGGKALIPSNVKVAAAGARIDLPLGHKDDPWSFDEIDTMTIDVPGAPRPDEIVVIVGFADGGRPKSRVYAGMPASASDAPDR